MTLEKELTRMCFHEKGEIQVSYKGSCVFKGTYDLFRTDVVHKYQECLFDMAVQEEANGIWTIYITEA